MATNPGPTLPATGFRYWSAMCLASICGANAGDVVMDDLHLAFGAGLLYVAIAFATLLQVNARTTRWRAARYWTTVLLVRIAATILADMLATMTGSRVAAAIAALLILVGIVATRQCWFRQGSDAGGEFHATASYWAAMFAAGTLGTLMADAAGHLIAPVTIGVPVAAAVGSLAVLACFILRERSTSNSAATYWSTIVAIRTWGTSVGDITGFLMTRPVSMVVSCLLQSTWLSLSVTPADSAKPSLQTMFNEVTEGVLDPGERHSPTKRGVSVGLCRWI